MSQKRTKIYINANAKDREFIYTGIEFYEFVHYLRNPIEHILLLKSNYMGNGFANNFELVEGLDEVGLLAKEDVNSYGDFCFVDYKQADMVNQLTDEQIAELLYLGHMYKPLTTPFFEKLDNQFAYLAHDDGFFCKLYCRHIEDFATLLAKKIQSCIEGKTKYSISEPDKLISCCLLELAENGLLIDFDELTADDDHIFVNYFLVGKYTDMDRILNENERLKEKAIIQNRLAYTQCKWKFD
ncbi:hypothetical protein [Dehalobacterium formicoaceticum]|uniref:hypothetical protein n=1 Tax=Dehalobacterium formicoaceticum TaxID=51515 RepID=UPI000B7F0FC7|nr:hypothetical protein [Dehalobacterium formicoaceticum]